MLSRTLRPARLGLLAIAALAALPAPAQEPANDPRPRRRFSSTINVDALLDNYVRFIARKYGLNDEQDAFTQQFVRAKAEEFLDRHRDELGQLVDRLFEVRTGGDMSTDELMGWGRRVMPIYEDAKQVLVLANAEWREILTDDQLRRIVSGQMTIDEFRNPGRPLGGRSPERPRPTLPEPAVANAPNPAAAATPATPQSGQSTAHAATPAQPPHQNARSHAGEGSRTGVPEKIIGRPGRPAETPTRAAGGDYQSKWEAYVRQFIERYKLNPEQRDTANKILRSCQEQAGRYMRARQPEIDRLDRRLSELRGTKDSQSSEKAKELADLSNTRSKMLAPLDDIFEKSLKPRLEKLPTRAQREAADKRQKAPAEQPGKGGGSGR